jgi:hypothetical protein
MYNISHEVDLFPGLNTNDIITKPLDKISIPFEFGYDFNKLFQRILSRDPEERPSFSEIVELLMSLKS